jgi:hypothetical protein
VKHPFTLVPSKGSTDTKRCVAELDADAKEKRLIGLAYVALYSGRVYEVHSCGEASRSPTFAAGAVGILKRQLEDKVLGA